jgi:hypothetical protein
MHFSYKASVFHGRTAPEEGIIVGYAAIINSMKLYVSTFMQVISVRNASFSG